MNEQMTQHVASSMAPNVRPRKCFHVRASLASRTRMGVPFSFARLMAHVQPAPCAPCRTKIRCVSACSPNPFYPLIQCRRMLQSCS